MNGYYTEQTAIKLEKEVAKLNAQIEAIMAVVKNQGKQINALKAKPPQIIRYNSGNRPCQ